MTPQNTVYRLVPETRVIQSNDGWILLNPEKGSWAKLSADAGRLCHEALGMGSQEIRNLIGGECGQDAASHMLTLFDELQERDLVAAEPRGLHVHDRRIDMESPRYSGPQKVYFVVTDKCNLSCTTCYRQSSYDEGGSADAQYAARLIAMMLPREVVVTGGEPTLRKDLFDLVGRAGQSAERVVLATNGTLVDEVMAERIKDLRCDVQVSIESHEPGIHDSIRGTGSFEAAMRGIRNLVAAGVGRVELVSTVVDLSSFNVQAMTELAAELGAEYHMSLFQPVGRGRMADTATGDAVGFARSLIQYLKWQWRKVGMPEYASFEEVLDLAPRTNCGAGERVLAVSSRGRIFPCHLLMDSCEGFEAREAQHFLDQYGTLNLWGLKDVDEMLSCSECDMRYFCGGGCRAAAHSAGGRDGRDPRCEAYKIFFRSMLWSWDDERPVEVNLDEAWNRTQ